MIAIPIIKPFTNPKYQSNGAKTITAATEIKKHDRNSNGRAAFMLRPVSMLLFERIFPNASGEYQNQPNKNKQIAIKSEIPINAKINISYLKVIYNLSINYVKKKVNFFYNF